MEDNSNMSGPTTSETDEVGGNGKDVSDLVEAAGLVEVFANDDSGDIGISSGEQSHQSGTHSRCLLQQDGDRVRFDIRFKMVCALAKIQCGNSIIYIYI